MDDKQFVIEREYLGKASTRELISNIIQIHISSNKRYCESNCEKPLNNSFIYSKSESKGTVEKVKILC